MKKTRNGDGLMEQKQVKKQVKENIRIMEKALPIQKSFDVIERKIKIGDRDSAFYFIDGFSKDEAMLKILDAFFALTKEQMPATAEEFIERNVPYIEVELLEDYDQVIKNILSGVTCLFIDGYDSCMAIDCRTYPARSVEEPEKDKALRGSKDGFVETIVFNTALMRRRIRSADLIMEMKEIGTNTRTDVAVCYMKDRVDQTLLDTIFHLLDQVKKEDLIMGQQSLAEKLYQKSWINPFPKYKYSERPDTAAACLLEGKIVILVDNSPSALILPTSILDMIEEANDYYFPPLTGIYLKSSRALITLLTVFLVPVYLLLIQNPQWIPRGLLFIQLKEPVHVPPLLQILILELSIDGLRLAALNTPSMLSTPLSVIAGIVMGEFSVKSGWFNAEIMLYMAFVSVANYTQPNFELGYALKFMRLLLMILTVVGNGWGFLIGTIWNLWLLATNKTLSQKGYLKISKN